MTNDFVLDNEVFITSLAYPAKYVILTKEMRDQAKKPFTKKQWSDFFLICDAKYLAHLDRNFKKLIN